MTNGHSSLNISDERHILKVSKKFLARLAQGEKRGHIVLRTSIVSALGKVLSIAGTFVTIPLVVNYLGPERYGLWMTITTLFVFLQLADGGITIGLIPLASQAHGLDDKKRIRALFSTAIATTILVMVGLALTTLLIPLVDWKWLLNLTDPSLQKEAAAITVIIILSVAMGYPSGATRQLRNGLQQGAETNLWGLVATLLTFVGQLTAIYCKLGLVALVTATALTPVAINALMSFTYLRGKGKELMPSWRLVDFATARTLFATGSVFMALVVAQALAVQIDQVLIAKFLSVSAVADYSVTQKLLIQPQFIVTLFLAAQFPAYGEALMRGDFDWIRHHFKLSLIGAVVFGVLACGMIGLLLGPILHLWIGEAIRPSGMLVMSMTVYGMIAVLANLFTYFYYALGLYRRIILAHVIMIGINIPLTIFLIPHLGSAGAIIATSVGYVVALIIPSFIALPGVLRELPQLRDESVVSNCSTASLKQT